MKWLLMALLASSSFDVATTEIALGNHRIAEGNPILQNRSARITIKIAAPVAIWYVSQSMPRKWRIVAVVAASAVWTYYGIHNIRTMHHAQRYR